VEVVILDKMVDQEVQEVEVADGIVQHQADQEHLVKEIQEE
jgi:desulfoferrodoxin (superoxide reductase-like protein)